MSKIQNFYHDTIEKNMRQYDNKVKNPSYWSSPEWLKDFVSNPGIFKFK